MRGTLRFLNNNENGNVIGKVTKSHPKGDNDIKISNRVISQMNSGN